VKLGVIYERRSYHEHCGTHADPESHVCALSMKVYSGILERFAWFNRAADTGGLRTLKGSIRSALTEIRADSISIIRLRAKETSVEGFYVTTCKI
jgi:hypothetical protein